MSFWGKLLGKDSIEELRDVMINLEFLADAETQISRFYRLCAGVMEKEKDLWSSLADAEMQHADYVGRMMVLIRKQPDQYKPGISFSTVNLRMFAVEMQRLAEEVNAGRKSRQELFSTALEIEDSVVEIGYGGMVRTEDAVFKSLAHLLDSESIKHKASISEKMSAVGHP